MEMLPMRDGRTYGRRTREDRATQPMDAGWLSFAIQKGYKADLLKFVGGFPKTQT